MFDLKNIGVLVLALLGLFIFSPDANAQNVGINNTGAAPDSSALLDISASDKGLLIPRMTASQRQAIVNPAKGLMVYDSTAHHFMYYDGSHWTGISGGDQLGNHSASQNLVLPAGKWMDNNKNNDKVGLTFSSDGYMGIGTEPGHTPFRIRMTKSVQANIYQNQINTISGNLYWQSFTPTISGELTSIALYAGAYNATYELYEGEGTTGTLISSGSIVPFNNGTISFANIPLTAGQIYTINISSADNQNGIIFVHNGNPYPGGRSSAGAHIDAPIQVYMNIPDLGFGYYSNTSNFINFNHYTFTPVIGSTNQILTRGFQTVVGWANQTDADHQNLSLSGPTLSLTNDASTVDLSSLLDNTDAQDLSLNGHLLSLSNDPTPAPIDLSPYLITDDQDLSFSGTTLSLSNDASPVDLSGIPIADQQDLSLSGNNLSISNDATPVDLSGYLDADHLGDHITTQNLQLNNNWLSDDGGKEGIFIDTTGQVGVGVVPVAPFHVFTKSSLVEQYYPLGVWFPHSGALWQSFTAEYSDTLHSIALLYTYTPEFDFELYAGEGTGGTLLYSSSTTNGTLHFSGVTLVDGQKYTFNILNTHPNFGIEFSLNDYAGGKTNIETDFGFGGSGYDVNFKVFYKVNDPGLRVANTGITFNRYTFPLTDGTSDQLLTTNGSGNLSWNAQFNTDAQDLSLNNDTLFVTGSANKIGLNDYLDNTDNQDLTLTNDTLFLTNDPSPVSLVDYINTDNQDLSLSGNTLSLSNDATAIDLSDFQQDLSISNDTLFLSGDPGTVNLANYRQTMSFANDSVYLSNDATPVGLDAYRQSISHVGDSLYLSYDATPVDLSVYVNTDHQDLSLMGNSLILSNDATPVDLSTIVFPDQQDLSLIGNTLSVTKDATPVDMSIYVNPDNLGNHLATQNIQMNNNWLSNDGGNEGIYVDAAGRVGIGMQPDSDANFQAAMGAGSPGLKITDTGVGIGRTPMTNLLEVEGNASKATAGDWYANSDARLKKNIVGLDAASTLDKLLSLQGVSYEWNDDKTGSKRPEGIQYGFTAQNMQEIFPTLVSEDNLGFLQTSYGDYDAHFIEAFRALQQMIDQLEENNEAMEEKVKARNEQLAQLAAVEAQLKEVQAMRAEIARLSVPSNLPSAIDELETEEE